MTTTAHTKAMVCPACRKALVASTSIGGDYTPEKGAASVCIFCATVLIFDSPSSVHAITKAEELALPDEARDKLSEIQAAIKSLKRQKGEMS